MATATLTKTLFPVTHTNNREGYAGLIGYKVTQNMYTLKGRLEFPKDYKAVMVALLSTPGVEYIEYDTHSVTIGWVIGHILPADSEWKGTPADNPGLNPEWVENTQKAVEKFTTALVDTYKNTEKYPQLAGLGIEPHVFIESLKPITEFDGERNGPLSSQV